MDNYKNVALIETDNLGGRTLPPHSLLANLTGDQERIRGLYRIERMVQRPRYDGQSYWMVELSDCSRSLICYGWPGSLNYDIPFERHTIVQVEIVTRLFNNKIVADIREMKMIKTPVLHGIELLPSPLCPVSGVLIRLAQLVRDIEVPVLKQFLNHMLSRDEIVLPFLTAPASICYHHNYPGGLLEHSVEVAEIVAGLPILNQTEKELAIIGALLHDIGKIWTMDDQMRRTDLGRLVQHDHLTLEVCAPALNFLDKAWPDAGILLRHVWTCASPGARYGEKSASLIADAVRSADRLSAERSNASIAFGKNTRARFASLQNCRYFRPRIS